MKVAPSATAEPRQEYIAQLEREAAVYPAVPDVRVDFDFSYTLHIKAEHKGDAKDNTAKAYARCIGGIIGLPLTVGKAVFKSISAKDSDANRFSVLKDCVGTVHPGIMTLLLAPAGHGKTSFLKALAGHVDPKKLEGTIRYNGNTQAELARQGVNLKLLASYVDQLDVHMPFLTVRETLEFAWANSTVRPELMGEPMLVEEAASRVDRVLRLLHLTNCQGTLVGDALVRGVSGGEKKRVTIAEALVSNARLFAMDEISTGLDSSVTFDICTSIKAWAQQMRGTVVIALLQPTPECFSLFDNCILLREGRVVFNGPEADAERFFESIGYRLPAPPGGGGYDSASSTDAAGAAAARDIADFITECITDPAAVQRRMRLERSAADLPALAAPDSAQAMERVGKRLPTTTAEFVAAWKESPLNRPVKDAAAPPAEGGLKLESDFARAQYGTAHPRGFSEHLAALVRRQATVTLRNRLFVQSRIISGVVMAAILGSVWFRLPDNKAFQKLAMLLFACMHCGFTNQSEVPHAIEQKFVAYKQFSGGMYPTFAFVLAKSIVALPIAIIETAAFGVIIFFMVDLNPGFSDEPQPGGRFVFFWLILMLTDMAMGALFRFLANILPNLEVGQTAPGPFIALQVIFAGFLIAPNHMGWLTFMYYWDVFGYALRSLMQSEFLSPTYSGLVPVDATQINMAFLISRNVSAAALCDPAALRGVNYPGTVDCKPTGEALMSVLHISMLSGWKWGGVGFLLGFWLVCDVISSVALNVIRIERNTGTRRGSEKEQAEEGDAAEVEVAASAASALPFTPMTLVWRDIEYEVNIPRHLGGGSKVLLQKVSGAALPGRLMALMGASGAGKTTLMDVIAGRKSGGTMRGDVMLNGFEKEQKAFARLTAYCEQMDVHSAHATVKEALLFSAKLRLPASVATEQRHAFVGEVLELLQLDSIADRLIGDVGGADGLAPGQRKILTIAVEMVSNAPILFADEPTSALDSVAAQMVVREIRKVASTGRTVICTIHQPSKELFFQFDDICLLQRGGWQTYLGPVGHKGQDLVRFIESVPGARPCPAKMNPASWMLDVLAGTDSSGLEHESRVLEDEEVEAKGMHGVATLAVALDEVEREAEEGEGGAAGGAAGEKHTGGHSEHAGSMLPGPVLRDHLLQSAAWAGAQQLIERSSRPAEGAQPPRFDSVYARNFLAQMQAHVGRTMISFWRNTGLNYTRTVVLWGLMILFGVIYYRLDTNDEAGVQSLVSVIFMTSLFVAVVNLNTSVPVLIRERAVFARESFCKMYSPTVHALSYALVELPWLAFQVLLIVPQLYFMVGLNPDPEQFFFYLLVIFVLCYLFISIGHFAAAYFSAASVVHAFTAVLLPIFFVFGGLFLPYPDIPIYWKWLNKADPLSHTLTALIPAQFRARGCGTRLPKGGDVNPNVTDYCPMINALDENSVSRPIDKQTYVELKYGVKYEERWNALGYLVCFIAGLQVLHVIAVRFTKHIDR